MTLTLSILLLITCYQQSFSIQAQEPQEYDAKVSVAFDHNCDELFITNIRNAKKTIVGAIYALTNKDIVEALIDKADNNVQIRLKIDKNQAEFSYTKFLIKKMQNAGIQIILIAMKKNDHMHNKFAIIDNKIVITGSFNWTRNASEDNYENIILIKSETIAEKFTEAWKKIKKSGNL